MADCPATTTLTLPCLEGYSARCERPAARHRDHWVHVRCLSCHGPHYVEWIHGANLCPWCGAATGHRDGCPDESAAPVLSPD